MIIKLFLKDKKTNTYRICIGINDKEETLEISTESALQLLENFKWRVIEFSEVYLYELKK